MILPKRNEPSLKDLPDYVKEGMILHFVTDVGQAIRIALTREPEQFQRGLPWNSLYYRCSLNKP